MVIYALVRQRVRRREMTSNLQKREEQIEKLHSNGNAAGLKTHAMELLRELAQL